MISLETAEKAIKEHRRMFQGWRLYVYMNIRSTVTNYKYGWCRYRLNSVQSIWESEVWRYQESRTALPPGTYISISRGCRPICFPTISVQWYCVSRWWQDTEWADHTCFHLIVQKLIRIQGSMMPPVPSTGSTSKIAIRKAMTSAFSIPSICSPMVSSKKVSSMIFA